MFNSFPSNKKDGGRGNIKSDQEGVIVLANASLSTTQTITEVDLTKAFLLINFTPSSGAPNVDSGTIKAVLTNSTTITFTRYNSVGDVTISWEVIEFYNVKSNQSGSKSTSSFNDTQVITAVNISKSLVICTVTVNNATTNFQALTMQYNLSNTTTISFLFYSSAAKDIAWQVIEFY